jgi:multiple sugar transport system substrate-binding protein
MRGGFRSRMVIACLVAVGILALSASAGAGPYDKYKGTEIVVSWPALPHFDLAKKLIPQFEKETGIKVETDSLQYMKLHDKQVLEMAKPKGDYDVVAWVVFWKTEYVQKGLLTPLSQMFANPALVNPDYDIEDITPAYLQNGGVVGGRQAYLPGPSAGLYGISFSAQTSMMAYRKDLLEKHKIAVPKTYDELIAAAKIIKAKEGIGGVTGRAQSGHMATDFFLTHFAPQGGKILDDNFKPTLNGPEGVKTIEILKEFIATGPVGMAGYSYSEMKNSFVQGDAAFYLDDSKIRKTAEDPTKSKIVGKVGYALHPEGSQCGAGTGGFAMGIPANAKNKEAAFLFIQWFTSKKIDYALAEMGGDPIRTSTMNDPKLQAKFPEYKALVEQLKCAKADWRPLIPEWPQIDNQIIGISVSEAITGKKPAQQALDEAAAKIEALLDSKGYYGWK